MDHGRRQLGTRLDLWLQCVDGAGAPAMPDDVPQLKIWDAAGDLTLDTRMPVFDRFKSVGLFHLEAFLGAGYAAGKYNLSMTYVADGYHGIETGTFEIVGGGHQDGSVVGTYFYHRPHADFIVKQTETGTISRGRNPKVQ